MSQELNGNLNASNSLHPDALTPGLTSDPLLDRHGALGITDQTQGSGDLSSQASATLKKLETITSEPEDLAESEGGVTKAPEVNVSATAAFESGAIASHINPAPSYSSTTSKADSITGLTAEQGLAYDSSDPLLSSTTAEDSAAIAEPTDLPDPAEDSAPVLEAASDSSTSLEFTPSTSDSAPVNFSAPAPQMPPGIMAGGFINNQQSTIDGNVFLNGELTSNGELEFIGEHGLFHGPNGRVLNNPHGLEVQEAERNLPINLPVYEGLKSKTLGALLAGQPQAKAFDGNQQPLNSLEAVAQHLPSGTSGQLNLIEIDGNLNLPWGSKLANQILILKPGSTLNLNGAVELENVHLFVEQGNFNAGNIQGQDISIFVKDGELQMNQGARFGGKSQLVTKNGDIKFNGASYATESDDYLQVLADGGSIYYNASTATQGRFRATGDFIQNGNAELMGLIGVKGDVRLNGEFRFEAKWPSHIPVVALLDTGVSALSSDLDYANMINAYDYVGNDTDSFLGQGEGSEHGTFIAGLIAALNKNGTGIDGANDQTLLYNSRVTGSGEWAQALLDYVNWFKTSGQQNGIAVVASDLTQKDAEGNVSTRFDLTPKEREALKAAWNADITVIVPMGNEGGVASVLGQTSQEHGNVLSVIALDGDVVAPYSNRGRGGVISTEGGTKANPVRSLVGDGIGTMVGTSVAAGSLAGDVVNVLLKNPDLNSQQLRNIFTETATDLGPAGWDKETGYGKVNIEAALEQAGQTQGEEASQHDLLLPTTWIGQGEFTPHERPTSSDEQADDHKSSAQTLTLNTDISGSLNNPVSVIGIGNIVSDEQDWFKFTLDQRSSVTVTRGYETSGLGLAEVDFQLEMEDGTGIGNFTDVELEPGNYYIQARLYTLGVGQSASYDLRVDAQPLDTYGAPGLVGTLPTNPTAPGETPPTRPVGFSVYPPFSSVYNNSSDVLGAPTSSVSNPLTRPSQTFENGIIADSLATGIHAVSGNIWNQYQNHGGVTGSLGFPTSSAQTIDGTTWQSFENGTLFSRNGQSLLIDERLSNEYFYHTGPKGWLGVPISKSTNENGFIKQEFQNGYIIWNGVDSTAYLSAFSNHSPEAEHLTFPLPVYCEPNGMYQRSSAVSYAQKYALQENPAFVRHGNDCTGFVSQALYAGGFISGDQLVDEVKTGVKNSLFYGDINPFDDPIFYIDSPFYAAESLYHYLTDERGGESILLNRDSKVHPLDQLAQKLKPGDVIFYGDSEGKQHHTSMYIGMRVEGNKAQPYIAQHSRDAIKLANFNKDDLFPENQFITFVRLPDSL